MEEDPFDVELGEIVEVQRHRREAGMVVSVRLDRTDAVSLGEAAERTGRTVSQIAREAIHGYLTGLAMAHPATSITVGGTGNFTVYERVQSSSTKGPAVRTSAPSGQPLPSSQFLGAQRKIA